jgi:energy-coupling factor transporter ATP-binding protein EcfA2
MLSAPLGRAAEWERLLARLKARKPALVLIAGPPGSGRTTLLDALATAGPELGYSVIGGRGMVAVDRTTRPSDLRRIIASELGAQPKSPPMPRGFLQRIAARLFRPNDEKVVLGLLKTKAPAILAIDGYAPGRGMSEWFADRLMPRIVRSGAPILVLVADRIESMAGLRDAATETIELGPVSRDAVQERLRAAGAGLDPPLSDGELAAYCDAVADDLGLLTPLEEVLSTLRPET